MRCASLSASTEPLVDCNGEKIIRDGQQTSKILQWHIFCNTMYLDAILMWYMFIVEKYDLVGRLLKPGEEPTDYTDTEEEHSAADRPKDD